MTSIALKLRKQWEYDNTILDSNNLEIISVTYVDDHIKKQRVYTFEDGSQIVEKQYLSDMQFLSPSRSI